MKTILVLSPHPGFPEAIRASAESRGIPHRPPPQCGRGRAAVVHGLASAVILDAELMGVESVLNIERLRRHNKKSPIIAFTDASQADWEEEAFCMASRTS